MQKKGEILVETIIFVILNLIFISILILFLFRQGEGAVMLERSNAKEIALLIDAAKPEMTLKLNMKNEFELAEKNGVDKNEIVSIKDNIVQIKLSEKSGYSYSFFNDVDASAYPDQVSDNFYIIKINEYKNA